MLIPFSAFSDGELYYTVVPNMAYLSSGKSVETNGAIQNLVENLAKEKKLLTRFVSFKNAKNAIESSKVGYGKEEHSLDLIGGIYYDEKIANFMEYIYPPIFEDYLLLVLPSRSSFSLQQLADFRSLDDDLPAVVIEGVFLGEWWKNLISDNKKPLRVLKVKTINDAMKEVLNGRAYFVGSGLMVRDYLSKNPESFSQIKGQFITENGKKLTRSIFLAINRDFLDLFSSLELERVFSEKLHELKESGELEKQIDLSKELF